MADQEMIARRAASYVAMEGHVHDLANMASIASEAMGDLGRENDLATLSRACFTVYHLDEMIRRFKKRYVEQGWSEKDLYPGASE
jgi:ATP-dependent RNA circularization protein (DNA/RNA ligase family)